MSETERYPGHWEADVVLRDGVTAHLRPIRPDDAAGVQAFHLGQSETSIYYRFFTYKSTLSPKELARFTHVDYRDRVAFVITVGNTIIGIGRFDRLGDSEVAEVAFNVADEHQGRGLASILLEHLAAAALERGIRTFSAEILPENRKMLGVFTDAGYDISRKFEDGVIAVRFAIDPTDKSLAVMQAREHRAESRSVAQFLTPRSIAVLGVSEHPKTLGSSVYHNIWAGDFTGKVYAVASSGAHNSPESKVIAASGTEPFTLYRSLASIEESIELAIIAVPYSQVLQALQACVEAQVKALLVMSSGFADDAEEGGQNQNTLVKTARSAGMRVLGPASMGVVNTNPSVSLNASSSRFRPLSGHVALFSQSAGLGSLLYGSAFRHSMGISAAVSAGNRADISGNDLMQYWEDDPDTSVVGMYLESIGNPRKFSRIARRLARQKPVIVAKSDFMGLQLPAGHAVRTSQAPTGALNAMLRQSGVIRVSTNDHLVEVASILASQPLPRGANLAVITNSLALGKVIADSAKAHGLHPSMLKTNLNLSGNAERIDHQVSEAMRTALESAEVDMAVVAFMASPEVESKRVAAIVYRSAVQAGKAVVASFTALMNGAEEPDTTISRSGLLYEPSFGPVPEGKDPGLPCFSSPGAAVRALAKVVSYATWKHSEHGEFTVPSGIDEARAKALITSWSRGITGTALLTLSSAQSVELLACYGVHALPSIPVASAQEAVAAAKEVGWPVALKSTDAHLRHRLDLGGVRLNLADPEELITAFNSMREALKAYSRSGMEIQHMAPPGQACVVKATEDPLLGPVLSFGIAGDATQLLDDWAHRVPPLSNTDISHMVRAPRASAKLDGYRGVQAVNIAELEDVIARVAELKDQFAEIVSLSLDPLLVGEQATVLSATIRLGDPQVRTDSARRALN